MLGLVCPEVRVDDYDLNPHLLNTGVRGGDQPDPAPTLSLVILWARSTEPNVRFTLEVISFVKFLNKEAPHY